MRFLVCVPYGIRYPSGANKHKVWIVHTVGQQCPMSQKGILRCISNTIHPEVACACFGESALSWPEGASETRVRGFTTDTVKIKGTSNSHCAVD